MKNFSRFSNRDFNKPTLESRVARLERILKNEGAKMLPDGTMVQRVSDVLTGLTGKGWARPREAIRELDRMGILDMATNTFYPTVDDVADAIEDCWNDVIGSGRGAAEFFIGNFDGTTKCSLTLYPISGGNSRARKITLKFDWPE